MKLPLIILVYFAILVQKFVTKRDEVLLSESEVPNGKILESVYKMRVRESELLEKQYWQCTNKTSINIYRS